MATRREIDPLVAGKHWLINTDEDHEDTGNFPGYSKGRPMLNSVYSGCAVGALQPILAHGLTTAQWWGLAAIFLGPFILAGLLVIAAAVVCFWNRAAAGVCLLLALSIAFFGWMQMSGSNTNRELRSHWTAGIAEDPVSISGTGVRDEDLALLRKTTKLKSLNLADCSLTEDGLKHLVCLRHLESLSLRIDSNRGRESGLKCLKELPQLRELKLFASDGLTDADLEYCKDLMELRSLDLTFTRITDAGLGYLKGLSELRVLKLGITSVTDAGLKTLCDLNRLEVLDLGGVRGISDTGAGYLKAFPQLRVLELRDTGITDVGVDALVSLKQLEKLDLGGTNITNVGVARLETLTMLKELRLEKTKITDAGLQHLKGLVNLKRLTVSRSAVSESCEQELRNALFGGDVFVQ